MEQEKNIQEVIDDLEKIKDFELGSYVIRYQGKAIRLANGKCLWKQPSHAKSALANHCETIYYYSNFPRGNKLSEMGFKNATELAQYLISQGILTVEKL